MGAVGLHARIPGVRLGARWTLGLALTIVSPGANAQDPVADFYQSHSLEIVVGNATGGGFDLFARFLAQYLGRYIPGRPTVTVRNMPGAAGLRVLQHIAYQAPKDGTVIGLFNSTLITESVLEPDKLKVDLHKVSWIGSLSSDTKVCFAAVASGVRNADDVRRRGMIIGGTAQGSTSLYGSLFQAIVGDRLKLVYGYESNNDVWLAVDRGEIEGSCTGWGVLPAARPDWISGRKIEVLVQFADKANSALPNVPLAMDLAATADLKSAISFLTYSDRFTRPFAAPADIPAARLQALRSAFAETVKDPRFLQAATAANIEIDPISGEALRDAVTTLLGTPSSTVGISRRLSGR